MELHADHGTPAAGRQAVEVLRVEAQSERHAEEGDTPLDHLPGKIGAIRGAERRVCAQAIAQVQHNVLAVVVLAHCVEGFGKNGLEIGIARRILFVVQLSQGLVSFFRLCPGGDEAAGQAARKGRFGGADAPQRNPILGPCIFYDCDGDLPGRCPGGSGLPGGSGTQHEVVARAARHRLELGLQLQRKVRFALRRPISQNPTFAEFRVGQRHLRVGRFPIGQARAVPRQQR